MFVKAKKQSNMEVAEIEELPEALVFDGIRPPPPQDLVELHEGTRPFVFL